MLEFQVLSDRNSFIDLIYVVLLIKCKIYRHNDAYLRTSADAASKYGPYFSNIVLHFLFSEFTVSANGLERSINNRNYAHNAVIETWFYFEKTAKNMWPVCQRYYYVDEPSKIDGINARADNVMAKKAPVANSKETYFIEKPACDTLTCDKHLISGVTLQIL